MKLLIAEDDRALSMFLTRGLESDGHRVRCTADGAAAVAAFREDMPDLTVLDLNLPVKDGEQALEEMRALDPQLPILVLTGRQEVETRIRCLDLGADDLMVKPFSLHELRARCRALLRRKREAKLMLKLGDLELDRLDHTVRRAGEAIALTNKEFALIEHLILHRGQCVSRVELLDAVWNMEPAQTTNIVDVYVNYLRRKLKDPPPGILVRTVRGQGYLVPSEMEMQMSAAGQFAPVSNLAARASSFQASPGNAGPLPTDSLLGSHTADTSHNSLAVATFPGGLALEPHAIADINHGRNRGSGSGLESPTDRGSHSASSTGAEWPAGPL